MERTFLFSALLASFSLPALAENTVEFTRHVDAIRGVEIVDGEGSLAIGDENFIAGGEASFRLLTNSTNGKERVTFTNELTGTGLHSNNSAEQVEIRVNNGDDGLLRNSDEVELGAGVHKIGARLNTSHSEMPDGDVTVTTTIEIR